LIFIQVDYSQCGIGRGKAPSAAARGPFFNISNFTRALNLLFTGCRYFSAPAFYFRTARAAACNALTLTPLFRSLSLNIKYAWFEMKRNKKYFSPRARERKRKKEHLGDMKFNLWY